MRSTNIRRQKHLKERRYKIIYALYISTLRMLYSPNIQYPFQSLHQRSTYKTTFCVVSNWYKDKCGLVLGTSILIWCHPGASNLPANAFRTESWYSLRFVVSVSSRRLASHGKYPNKICQTIGLSSSGMPFHANFFNDGNGTTGISRSDLNFWRRVDWGVGLIVGVGGRMEDRKWVGSRTSFSVLGFMPVGLGAGLRMG